MAGRVVISNRPQGSSLGTALQGDGSSLGAILEEMGRRRPESQDVAVPPQQDFSADIAAMGQPQGMVDDPIGALMAQLQPVQLLQRPQTFSSKLLDMVPMLSRFFG